MARGQHRRERNGQQAKMLQAMLLGAAMGSTRAFVSPMQPPVAASTPSSTSCNNGRCSVRPLGSSGMEKWVGCKAQLKVSRPHNVKARSPRMVSAGVERGMFTTSSPEDRRVTPESRDGKAYFKVSPMSLVLAEEQARDLNPCSTTFLLKHVSIVGLSDEALAKAPSCCNPLL